VRSNAPIELAVSVHDPLRAVMALESQVTVSGATTPDAEVTVALPVGGSSMQVLKYIAKPSKPTHLVRFKSAVACKVSSGGAGAGAEGVFAVAKVSLQVPLSNALSKFDCKSLTIQVSLAPLLTIQPPLTSSGDENTSRGTTTVGKVSLQPTKGAHFNAVSKVMSWAFALENKPLPKILEYQALVQLVSTERSAGVSAGSGIKAPSGLPGIVKVLLGKSLLSEVEVDVSSKTNGVSLNKSPKAVLDYSCRAEYKFL